MEFSRKKVRGKSQQTYREYYDESKQYRVYWRCEWEGIAVEPAAYACVQCVTATGIIYWDFVGRRGPYRTEKRAMESAEKHRRVWDKFFEIATGERKGRAERIRNLDLKAREGEDRIMSGLPVWVKAKADFKILEMLQPKRQSEDDLDDRTETSPITDDLSSVMVDSMLSPISDEDDEPGPALDAVEQDSPSIEIGTDPPSKPKRARAAKAQEKAPKRSAKKPTSKRSRTGKTKSAATKS